MTTKDYRISREAGRSAGAVCWDWMQKRIQEKGSRSFSCIVETYGVIVEEYCELTDAVRQNDHAKVRHEVRDIFVPCLFDMAAWEERAEKTSAAIGFRLRVDVDQEKARQLIRNLERQLTNENIFSSIHDILG